ncbi:MAG TPA: hypothetical protein ENI43_01465 [Firmicutes bacterium]|nr:hypothetical protein [Bacillota bacterium]
MIKGGVIIPIMTIMLGLFSISQGGVYYVEVPSAITDDMFFGRSEYIDSKLMELVYRELEGKKEEIAVVIFTRDGEPIRPSSIDNDLNIESTEIPKRTEPPHSNELEFLWCINRPYYWVLN